MRSHIRVFGAVSVIAVVAAGIAACSSDTQTKDDGSDPRADQDSGTSERDASRPPTTRDAGRDQSNPPRDSGKDRQVQPPDDAAPDNVTPPVDAGPDVFPADAGLAGEGTPCANENDIQVQVCGYCGTKSRV